MAKEIRPELDGAILQRDKVTYAVVPRTPVGIVTPEQLEAVAAAARKYSIPIVKITSGQRFALVGVKQEDLPSLWKDLGMDKGRAVELCLHYVQACPGTAACKFGVQDSLGLGRRLEREFAGRHLPAKVKIGVSGCPLCCGESFVRDIGAFAKKSGWTLLVGGSSTRKPRTADMVAEDLSEDDVVRIVDKILALYSAEGNKRERMARFVERLGIERVKEAVQA